MKRKKYKRFNPLHVLYKTKFLRVDNFQYVIFYSITKIYLTKNFREFTKFMGSEIFMLYCWPQ